MKESKIFFINFFGIRLFSKKNLCHIFTKHFFKYVKYLRLLYLIKIFIQLGFQ